MLEQEAERFGSNEEHRLKRLDVEVFDLDATFGRDEVKLFWTSNVF